MACKSLQALVFKTIKKPFEELLHLLTLSQVHNGSWRASSEYDNGRLSIEQKQLLQID